MGETLPLLLHIEASLHLEPLYRRRWEWKYRNCIPTGPGEEIGKFFHACIGDKVPAC